MLYFILGFLICFILFIIVGIILYFKFMRLPAIIRSSVSKPIDKKDYDIEKWF